MYDQYNMVYLQDFSEAFFNASMVDEWFQDRYNPIRIHNQEQTLIPRAATESAAIAASLFAQPAETVKAMCLDPHVNTASDRKRAQSVSASDGTASASTDEISEDVPSVPLATRHITGHIDRTLYISGIHACCTKLALQNAVTAALALGSEAAAAVVPAPDRIVMAQPVWTSTDGIDKFERFAWIVMPTAESAKAALSLLSNLRVDVHAPLDPDQREPIIAATFTVHARPHHPKPFFEKNEFCSHHLRVQADLVRALELASLLDEEREVPTELRLAVLIDAPAVVEACVKPTDRLDVAIAYLRRVHLLNFYGARKFQDESQLLSQAPSVFARMKDYIPAPPLEDSAADATMEEEAPAEETVAAVGSKRKQRDEDDEEEGQEEGQEEGGVVAGMEVEGAAPAVAPRTAVKRAPHVSLSNP